jgi:hypothetical protein
LFCGSTVPAPEAMAMAAMMAIARGSDAASRSTRFHAARSALGGGGGGSERSAAGCCEEDEGAATSGASTGLSDCCTRLLLAPAFF